MNSLLFEAWYSNTDGIGCFFKKEKEIQLKGREFFE